MTGVEDNNKEIAITYSIVETIDEERVKSFIDVLAGIFLHCVSIGQKSLSDVFTLDRNFL